jgi:hypothetical protein
MKYRIRWRHVVTGDEGLSNRAWALDEAVKRVERANQSTKYDHWLEAVPHLQRDGWVHEDELPPNYPYDAMFSKSQVFGGVRMFPDVTL